MVFESASKIKRVGIAAIMFGALIVVPSLGLAQPSASPPGGNVDAQFDTVTVGPGLFNFFVSSGGGSNTQFSTTGNLIYNLSGGVGSLFIQSGGPDSLAMNAYGIWSPNTDLKLVDNVDITYSLDVAQGLNVDSGTLYVNNSSNRVGIGTTSPFSAFHVAGEGRFDGSSGLGLYARTAAFSGSGIAGIFDNGGGTAVELSDPNYSIEANGDIVTYAKIYANSGVGKYTDYAYSNSCSGSYCSIYKSYSCPSLTYLVNCGADSSSYIAPITDVYASANTCVTSARLNATSGSFTLTTRFKCFDPRKP